MKRFTYFATPANGGPMKIGRSGNPNRRVKQIRPEVSLFAVVPESELSEKEAHTMFAAQRVGGEWFEVTETEVLQALAKGGIFPAFSIDSKPKTGILINLEIDDEEGAMLDALANEQDRSRSAQARRLLIKAIRAAANQPEEDEA